MSAAPVERGAGVVAFQVYGLPIAQGSKTPWGTDSAKGLKSWRQDVAVAARNAMGRGLPVHEAVEVLATFIFPRPLSHFGTGRNAERLKESAPTWVCKKPDLDKLMRALGDAMTGVVIRDDSQIVTSSEVKVFGTHPGVIVTVRLASAPPLWSAYWEEAS